MAIEFAKDAVAGKYSEDLPGEDSGNTEEVWGGLLLDLNDFNTSQQEIEYVEDWILSVTGKRIEDLEIKTTLLSSDRKTKIKQLNPGLGKADDEVVHYLGIEEIEGKKPLWQLWPEEVYEWQTLEVGYEEI